METYPILVLVAALEAAEKVSVCRGKVGHAPKEQTQRKCINTLGMNERIRE